jgi:hypothetical protein
VRRFHAPEWRLLHNGWRAFAAPFHCLSRRFGNSNVAQKKRSGFRDCSSFQRGLRSTLMREYREKLFSDGRRQRAVHCKIDGIEGLPLFIDERQRM